MSYYKREYLALIKENINRLVQFQNKNGSFFYPQWKLKKYHFSNARWQEAVAPLAWYSVFKQDNKLVENIEAGINYWCKVQKKAGYYNEVTKFDRSFPATAFSLNAVSYAIQKIGLKKKWEKSLYRASYWLCKNDETSLTNQEAAAAVALKRASRILAIKKFEIAAENKLQMILESQKGYYPEKNGFDLGYSTLTLALLAQYHSISKDQRILDSAKEYCRFLETIHLDKIKNSRKTSWILITGFEYFANFDPKIKYLLLEILKTKNIHHLPDDRHLCTDLIWYCEAYDASKAKYPLKKLILEKQAISQGKSNTLINLLRPLGLHNIRKITRGFL